jgi:hypothetical protein
MMTANFGHRRRGPVNSQAISMVPCQEPETAKEHLAVEIVRRMQACALVEGVTVTSSRKRWLPIIPQSVDVAS